MGKYKWCNVFQCFCDDAENVAPDHQIYCTFDCDNCDDVELID